MGRTKQKYRKKKSLSKNDITLLSHEELLENAQKNIEIFEYEKAQIYCKEALSRDAEDIRSLEISGSLFIELGNIESAKHCLGRAITLAPDNGFTKFFSMGQLLVGKKALQCYHKGIEILKVNIAETEKENINATKEEKPSASNVSLKKVDPLIRKLSNAYCSIAELYMSDLCDEEEAEKESESYSKKAIECDSTNPEAYQHYANFLLIKEDIEGAKKNIKMSVSLWLPDYQKVDDGTAAAGTFDPVDVCSVTDSARFSCSKILIEVSEHQLASEVLESLLAENDEDVYTWYLMGWNFYLEGEDTKPAAKFHLARALELHNQTPYEDLTIVEHLKELLEELKEVQDLSDDEDDLEENLEDEDLENGDDEMDVS